MTVLGIAECEHGLPQGCPLHHRSRTRRVLTRVALVAVIGLDLAVVGLALAGGYVLIGAAVAFIGGRL